MRKIKRERIMLIFPKQKDKYILDFYNGISEINGNGMGKISFWVPRRTMRS